MSKVPTPRIFGSLLAAALLLTAAARATEVAESSWDGRDLLIRFADSVGYSVDLAESDSSQLVIRVKKAELPSNAASGGVTLRGPKGRQAILTAAGNGDLRITVRANNRLGYASIWRPYSNTLLIHTFNWDDLEYGQEQYYKALLALEQGLEPQGLELLRIAYATGDSRAASALGVYHARRGEHALAAQYLAKPITADDHAALAAAQFRNGDSASALQSQQKAERMLKERNNRNWQRSNDMTRRGAPASPPPSSNNMLNIFDPNNRWLYLGAGILALILVIGVVIWLARRSSRRHVAAQVPPPPRREPDTRTVVAEEIPVVRTEPATEPRREPVVERPVVERPVVERIVEPVREPVAETPPPQEPVSEPAVAPPFREVTPVEQVRQAPEPPIAKAEAIDVEARPVASSSPRATEGLSTQAAELRRRIEEMRQQPASPPPPPVRTISPTESTLDEARRLQLSRDSVELRRRLQQQQEAEKAN